MALDIPGWVFEAIREYSGLDASLLSAGALRQALGLRVTALGLPGPAAYWPLLRGDGPELDYLVQALTNKETYFFREPRHFQVLRDRVLPELLAGHEREGAGVSLRLWSAGCATGEEAYSLAMTLVDFRQATGARFEATVVGSDVDRAALEVARQARYDERAVRLVPDELRRRYLARDGDRWRVVPDVTRLVTFRAHNLAAPCFPEDLAGLDVIFCRNVTIYFDEPGRERLNACLAGLLREGGYLFVASAETLSHDRGRLALVSLGEAFAFHKAPAAPERPQARASEPGGSRPRRAARASSSAPAPARPGTPKPAGKPLPAPPAPDASRRQDNPALEAARRAFHEQAYEAGLLHLDSLAPEDAAQPEGSCLRAAILLQQARPEEANQICRRLLGGDPWHPDAYLLLALGYRQLGQGAEAVDMLKQAVYLRPDDPQAHFFLADTYRMLGLAAEARREYENTLNILERPGAGRAGTRAGTRTRTRTPGPTPQAPGAAPAAVSLAGVSEDLMRRACRTHLSRSGPRQGAG